MITYEAKSWLRVLCSWHGTVIPRILPRILALSACTLLLWIVKSVVHGDDASWLFKPFKPIGHTLIGVALGLLIVFRNNCSYDRYWEGRKLWGSIVNASRNLLRGATIWGGDSRDLAKLMSAYGLALKQHLRGDKNLSEIETLLSPEVFAQVSSAANPPSIIAFHMSRWIHARYVAGKFDPVTQQQLEGQVRILLDNQGGCERILRTPIPFAYAAHIKQLLTLYLITLPFILVTEMEWFAIPATAVIAFGLLGIEEAGVEIEDPFGDDPNDLPIEAICATISRDSTALAELGPMDA